MKCLYIALLFILLSSCLDSSGFMTEEEFIESPVSRFKDNDACLPKQEMWICHNLESPNHDNECTEECYSAGENSKFCWYFNESNCLDDKEQPGWKQKYCPKLNTCD